MVGVGRGRILNRESQFQNLDCSIGELPDVPETPSKHARIDNSATIKFPLPQTTGVSSKDDSETSETFQSGVNFRDQADAVRVILMTLFKGILDAVSALVRPFVSRYSTSSIQEAVSSAVASKNGSYVPSSANKDNGTYYRIVLGAPSRRPKRIAVSSYSPAASVKINPSKNPSVLLQI